MEAGLKELCNNSVDKKITWKFLFSKVGRFAGHRKIDVISHAVL